MYSNIAANKRKTIFIMFVFIAFVSLILWVFSQYLGGSHAVFYGGMIGALVYVIFSYYAGSKMALAVNRAKEIQKRDNPRLWRAVENLSITEGLPMPRVYIIEDPALNAFATGRSPSNAAVTVTTGLLDTLDDNELEGVLAHELGHIKNYDIRVSMIAFALTAVISLLADVILHMTWFRSTDNNSSNNNQVFLILGIVAAILAPIIATMIQLAISRQREYLADATGALATRYPDGLIGALTKISQSSSTMKHQNSSTAHLFFANPLKGKGIANLFSTHPPIADRIARLEASKGRS